MMTQHCPSTSIILLSYNRPVFLKAALGSLVNQTYQNLDITVVDNPSPASAEIAEIVGRYHGVELIRNPVNRGFAGGMNRGIESAVGHYIYLTEDDIVLERDCIFRLVEHMEANPSAGLISPIMYNNTEGTIRCAGGEFSLRGIYLRRTHGAGERDAGQFPRPFDVTYIDGATVFARTDFLRRLAGFREEFFMYVEAVELCARVGKAGRKLTVVPGAKVYHFEPPDETCSAPALEFHKLKNLYSLYLLHAPTRHLPEFFCRYVLLAALRSAFGKGVDIRTLLKAVRWVAGRTPSLLKERRKYAPSRFDSLDEVYAGNRVSPKIT